MHPLFMVPIHAPEILVGALVGCLVGAGILYLTRRDW